MEQIVKDNPRLKGNRDYVQAGWKLNINKPSSTGSSGNKGAQATPMPSNSNITTDFTLNSQFPTKEINIFDFANDNGDKNYCEIDYDKYETTRPQAT